MKHITYKIHDTYHHDFGNIVAIVEFFVDYYAWDITIFKTR
jgi:hypothetical protein